MRIADRERVWSGTAFHSRIDGYAWARGTRLSKPTIREIEMKSLAMANGCLLQHLRHSNSIATQVQRCCPGSDPTRPGQATFAATLKRAGHMFEPPEPHPDSRQHCNLTLHINSLCFLNSCFLLLLLDASASLSSHFHLSTS
jgi:hypothetical protein